MLELNIRPTDKVIELVTENGATVPARIWQGKTSTGIPVHCYITWCAVPEGRPQHEYDEFEAALVTVEAPTAEVQAIPLRLVL